MTSLHRCAFIYPTPEPAKSGNDTVVARLQFEVCFSIAFLCPAADLTFTFSLFYLPAIICATEVLIYKRWGRICFNGFQLDQEHAVAFCRWAVEMVIWHLFFVQYGFGATMRMTRLEGTRGFPLLVFERLCCDELGLVVR